MHAKDSSLGNSCRQMSGNFFPLVPNLPLHGGFDLSNEYIRNQVGFSKDWRKPPGINQCRYLIRNKIFSILNSRIHYDQGKQAFDIANILENWLFMDAASQEEYMNQETFMQRLETHFNKLNEANCSQQVDSSISYISKTGPSSGLLYASWFNGSHLEPTIQTVTDPIINTTDYCAVTVDNKYGFPNEGLSHPLVVHEPVFSPDDGSSITTSTDIDVLSNFSVSGGGSNLEASSKLNSYHFLQQQADNLEMGHIKYRDCAGTLQKNDPMAFLSSMGNSLQCESSNLLTAQHVSRGISEVSNIFPGSRTFGDISQYQHQKLDFQQNPRHFMQPYEICVKTCKVHPSSCFANQGERYCQILGQKTLEQPSLFSGFLNQHGQFMPQTNVRENDDAMLPPSKRLKMDSSFGVHLINNASSVQLTPKIVQAYPSEGHSGLQQQVESPISDVTECNIEQFTNTAAFGQTFKGEAILSTGLEAHHISEESDLKSHNVKANSNSKESVIRSNSYMHTIDKEPLPADIGDIQGRNGFNLAGVNGADVEKNLTYDTFGEIFKVEPVVSICIEADHISEEPYLQSHDVKANSELKEAVLRSNSNMHTLCKEPLPADIEDIKGRNEFNQTGVNATEPVIEPTADQEKETMSSNLAVNTFIEPKIDQDKETKSSNSTVKAAITKSSNVAVAIVIEPKIAQEKERESSNSTVTAFIEPKSNQEKETKSSKTTVNTVSLIDFFTSNQITEHIKSLRKHSVQSKSDEEPRTADDSTCQICELGVLYYTLVPIYCSLCGNRITHNANYYYQREAEIDAQHCFCASCYRNSKGGNITFNGISVSKTLLDKDKNNRPFKEAWVECNKCKRWQHQICALYNDKRDMDCSAEYICPTCRLKEIENGIHVPLPETAIFGAKDLPRTILSDHIESRLYKRLAQESEGWGKVEGNKNLDEVLVAENLSVRVVLSADKQLKVKKQFLDIFVEEEYPAEFSYTLKVILLFQQIEGVDVCLFGMYVQEFGSECGYPNRRSVYISYLDSVKYFRPDRKAESGEALRTFVYHEILIGYLDFCKKRGFTTCYIWACPPIKGEDYILYCHPDTQKTPKNDKLRHWYHSMLRKASEENIVVGLTNVYDHFFVCTGNCDSKVTAARLPYFDGDYWSGAAMDIARSIEQESGGDYERMLKKQVTKRTLKSMGHVDPSKRTFKDILVMQRLGEKISHLREDFIIVRFQYECIYCQELMVSGNEQFCTECKKFQECESRHTADLYTSTGRKKHTLRQVLVDDILIDTKAKDIIIDNALFQDRHNFLSFCQKNQFQFDTLRRAKFSSMMILYHLHNPTMLTVRTVCNFCCKQNVFQRNWKCEICPEFTVCSECYDVRGAKCHVHKLNQTYCRAQYLSGNQELALMQKLQVVIKHASQCHSTGTQPCTYPHCLKIKKLFNHASRCTIRVAGGCQLCKKAWLGLTMHSRNCIDSGCRVPRCMDLKKHAEWMAMQSDLRRRAAVEESNRAVSAP